MDASPVLWPDKEDYDMAMDTLCEKVRDPAIRNGTLQQDKTGILRFGGAGLYATLYRVDDWMVRCFYKTKRRNPPRDILERYQHISRFTNTIQNVPALVPITYVSDAIEVDYYDRSSYNSYILLKTEILPFVRMPFIRGQSLGSFIAADRENRSKMEQLCNAWLQMICDLKSIRIAHGDLDLTNILVTEQSSKIVLKLIDYDNAWVPALGQGREQTEVGHPHFQHPAFQSKGQRSYDEHMDNFSSLVIYISLKALTTHPELYTHKVWGADDTHRLLLTSTDYEMEMQHSFPNHITLLRAAQIPGLELLLDELSNSLWRKEMPRSLDKLLPEDCRETPKKREALPQTPIPHLPVSTHSENNEREVIYIDWDQAEYNKRTDQPLVIPSTDKTTILEPTKTIFATATTNTRDEKTLPEASASSPRHSKKTKPRTRYLIMFLAILVLVILIIAAVLWFTNVIPHQSQPMGTVQPVPQTTVRYDIL